jgi:hypothetical protein
MRLACVLALVAACSQTQTSSANIAIDDDVERVDIRVDAGNVEIARSRTPIGTAELAWSGSTEPVLTSRMAGSTLLVSATCPDKSRNCTIDLSFVFPAEVGVDPVWWTPYRFREGGPLCRDPAHHTPPSSAPR